MAFRKGGFSGRYGVIADLSGANMNTTADQALRMSCPPKYRIDRITATNPSTSLSVAAGGIYTAVSKGGSAIVALTQVYSALVNPTDVLDLTLALGGSWTAAQLYLSLTAAQGGAATADLLVWGWDLS